MYRYFYDFEFEEHGETIIPISLGMVADDGRELYLVNKKYMQSYHDLEGYYWKDKYASVMTNWLCINVCDKISREDVEKYGVDYEDWGPVILDFISKNGEIDDRRYVELWAYFAAYDHVALAQVFGPMIKLPEPIPMYTHELMQLLNGRRTSTAPVDEHNALSDAKWNKWVWENFAGDRRV